MRWFEKKIWLISFLAEPIITRNEKTGDKMIHFVKKKREIDIANEGKISSTIMDFMNLWMKSVTANSKDCQRLHFCRVNDQIAHQSLLNWQLSEICTIGLAYKLVHKENDLKELLLGKVSKFLSALQ